MNAAFWSIVFQLIGVCLVLLAGINKKKSWILVLTFLANICSTMVMILVGRYDGAAATIVCTIRSFLFLYQDRVKTNGIFWVSVAAHLIVGILAWQSPLSVLIIAAPIVLCYVNWFGKPKTIKYGTIASDCCWTVFDIVNGVYIEAARDVAEIVSNVVGLIRIHRDREEENSCSSQTA